MQPARLAVALCLTAACATAAPLANAPAAPPPEDPSAYYPLTKGWRWAYDIERGGEKILATYAVTDVISGIAIVTAGEDKLGYMVLSEGITRKEGRGFGDFVLKGPIRVGTRWDLSDGEAQVTSVGATVTVEAGAFDNCAVVEEHRREPDRVIRTTFAAGVGPIIVEQQVRDGDRYITTLKATLRGVTRPGEDALGP
jgi:hypothetical protein